jgi:polyvinyl alcohol dehydrogenase (cytochrome)
MSSSEWAAAANPTYECCTFRGGVAALDAATGREIWKGYTIVEPAQLIDGPNAAGARRFHPAGAPVWNSPTIDAGRNRLYVGTGEAYTSPAAGTSDAVIAFDLSTGRQLWHYQSLAGDAWNMACFIGGGPNCPQENGPDLDIGASPVLLSLPDGRDVVVAGQKSADVFALDPDTGRLLWKTRTGRGGYAGGVHWGLAAAGTTVFAPSADTLFLPTDVNRGIAKPGLFALDAATGRQLWYTAAPDLCPAELKPACDPGLSAAVTAMPGVVFAGGFDGRLRAYGSSDGRVLWEYDTNREFVASSGAKAHGGSIESAGPVVVDGALLVNSGYLFGGRMPGNVLLKFSAGAAEPVR